MPDCDPLVHVKRGDAGEPGRIANGFAEGAVGTIPARPHGRVGGPPGPLGEGLRTPQRGDSGDGRHAHCRGERRHWRTRGRYAVRYDADTGRVNLGGHYVAVWRRGPDGAWQVATLASNAYTPPPGGGCAALSAWEAWCG